MNVTLREITADTVVSIIKLTVAESQKGYVASNSVSLAQALFQEEAWYRAVYLDDEPVGFVMLEDDSLASEPPDEPGVYLWRFMIDEKFQGRGIGKAALELVIEHVRTNRTAPKLTLSYVPGPGEPADFYRGFGFEPTGEVDEGEIVMALEIAR
ncbi:MAG: GNAT family N-acetyltransferase [Acidobacteriota bacterium]